MREFAVGTTVPLILTTSVVGLGAGTPRLVEGLAAAEPWFRWAAAAISCSPALTVRGCTGCCKHLLRCGGLGGGVDAHLARAVYIAPDEP